MNVNFLFLRKMLINGDNYFASAGAGRSFYHLAA